MGTTSQADLEALIIVDTRAKAPTREELRAFCLKRFSQDPRRNGNHYAFVKIISNESLKHHWKGRKAALDSMYRID